MITTTTIPVKKLMRQVFFFMSLLIVVGLAFARKGGNKERKKSTPVKNNFVPIRVTSPFTLKHGFVFTGSHVVNQLRDRSSLELNTMVTYQKGNTTYILPYKYRVNTAAFTITPTPSKGNLQMLDLKISMHK